MNAVAAELQAILDEYLPQLNTVSADTAYKSSPSKWSKKELMGHLIDSAQNNIRRFIVAQYEEEPTITYEQDKWVRINNYQAYSFADLVQLWWLQNKQIFLILNNTPAPALQRTCYTGSSHTLEWLALDYLRHLKHHLHQVLDLSPIAYP